MEICKPECAADIPNMDWVNGCNITTRPGGVARAAFLKCDPNMVFPFAGEWTNLENVKWAICQGYLFVTGPILGQKPKGSFTKRRLSSCSPEETISGSKTITWQDYNADNVNLTDFDFYSAIVENKKFMFFSWITCDDRWYQYPGSWDIEVDEVEEDTKDGKSFYDSTVTMATKDLIKPIIVPGLLATISSFNSATCYS